MREKEDWICFTAEQRPGDTQHKSYNCRGHRPPFLLLSILKCVTGWGCVCVLRPRLHGHLPHRPQNTSLLTSPSCARLDASLLRARWRHLRGQRPTVRKSVTDGAAVNETGRGVNAPSNESAGVVRGSRRGQAALLMTDVPAIIAHT